MMYIADNNIMNILTCPKKLTLSIDLMEFLKYSINISYTVQKSVLKFILTQKRC